MIAFALLLAACGPGEQAGPAENGGTSVAPATASTASTASAAPAGSTGSGPAAAAQAPFEPDAIARYTCQPGTRVALLRGDAASVLLPDGARYLLDRVAHSEPPVYAGQSLFFTVKEQGGYLSQADGARELACAPDAEAAPAR